LLISETIDKDFPSEDNTTPTPHSCFNMSRNVKYLERFEYCCTKCGKTGCVLDVLLNPEMLLIRGFCPACNKRGSYKVIDIEALRQEHEKIELAEAQASNPHRKPGVVWRWELQKEESEDTEK
jgi:hypothetical protein